MQPLRPLPNLIFASRWLQLPLYLGLIIAQAVYVWLFWQELYYLILAAFGVGYRGQTPQLDTILVLPQDQRLPDDPAAYRDMFSSVFVLKGVTRDRSQAEEELDRRQTDVVVIVPDQAEQTVLSGQHAQFDVLFREIDPLQAAWVRYFATVAVQELNRRVLADLPPGPFFADPHLIATVIGKRRAH